MQSAGASKRDPRVDVFRGLALLMIFVDHIPNNTLSLVTIRNFGFSDAAEIFVLLAGFSSMLAKPQNGSTDQCNVLLVGILEPADRVLEAWPT